MKRDLAKPPMTPAEIAEALRLERVGVGVRAIARQLGRNDRTIRRVLVAGEALIASRSVRRVYRAVALVAPDAGMSTALPECISPAAPRITDASDSTWDRAPDVTSHRPQLGDAGAEAAASGGTPAPPEGMNQLRQER